MLGFKKKKTGDVWGSFQRHGLSSQAPSPSTVAVTTTRPYTYVHFHGYLLFWRLKKSRSFMLCTATRFTKQTRLFLSDMNKYLIQFPVALKSLSAPGLQSIHFCTQTVFYSLMMFSFQCSGQWPHSVNN